MLSPLNPLLLLLLALPLASSHEPEELQTHSLPLSEAVAFAASTCLPSSASFDPDGTYQNVLNALPIYSQLILHTHSLKLSHSSDSFFSFRTLTNSLITCASHLCSTSSPNFSPPHCDAFTAHYATPSHSPHLPHVPPNILAAIYNDLATVVQATGSFKHDFLNAAYKLAPFEPTIVKNFAYLLEQSQREDEARRMYQRLNEVGGDGGTVILEAALCEPHHDEVRKAGEKYDEIREKLVARLESPRNGADGQLDADPAKLVSQMPIAWPYLGRSVRPLVSLLGENYKRYFPLVFGNSITEAQTNSNRIRLGVVAEYPGNTSPGHLIGAVVTSLANHFDIVFFKLATLDTEFSRAVEEVATEVHLLDMFDTIQSQNTVKSASVDTLIYIAVGMSPLSYYMAMSRLAPCVCVFAHGHPITTGLEDVVDYFVSSDLFEVGDGNWRMEEGRGEVGMLQLASRLSWHNFPPNDASPHSASRALLQSQIALHPAKLQLPFRALVTPPPSFVYTYVAWQNGFQDYSEQLVKFDTLTTWFKRVDCEKGEGTGELVMVEGKHYYACLQYSKKIHSGFDDVLEGVLRSDEEAVILMLDGARRFETRWRERGWDDNMMERVKFVQRMPRGELMEVLRRCKVMLGTFPWGDGVTTFEAFGMGLPVVVLAEKIVVEQLSVGQIRAMGLERELVAGSVQEYVALCVRLGTDESWRMELGRELERRAERYLFSEQARGEVVAEWVRFVERISR